MSAELARIKRRWTAERKVAASDVEWLLAQAERAEAMAAAKLGTRPEQTLADILGAFRRRP